MPSLSPSAHSNAMPTSPRPHGGAPQRPGLLKRHSTQSATLLARQGATSPGSLGEHHQHHTTHTKHAVRPTRHGKFVLPRNHSSGRNLAKLARQTHHPHGEETRRHVRKKSHDHEHDTEIRLPGSLDESRPPPMRRNLTAYQLPRAASHVKLKKNLSHGQLTRLQSGRNLQVLSTTQHKAPPSPGLKSKSKRKSVDTTPVQMDLHAQEVELLRQQKEGPMGRKKAGFAVGSAGDHSDDDEVANMDGSELHEDEWTEESASASPFSTRQNTANNSRRESVIVSERSHEKSMGLPPRDVVKASLKARIKREVQQQPKEAEGDPAPVVSVEAPVKSNDSEGNAEDDESEEVEEDEEEEEEEEEEDDDDDDEEDQSSSPLNAPISSQAPDQPEPSTETAISAANEDYHRIPIEPKAPQRSPFHTGREPPNPATRRILSRSQQLPAPALISTVSALDSGHSTNESPEASQSWSKSPGGGGSVEPEDELVSRFIPSDSHPTMSSGVNTTANTPKQTGFHTPTEEYMRRVRGHGGPTSPGSTISAGSSGAATPALGRSRIELKMMGEKALADREAVAERAPIYPHHVYDRRNETLKSYLNLASLGGGSGGIATGAGLSLGPEIFQGRFKAVNTELKVVLKFRDPIVESVDRLRKCKGSKLYHRTPQSSRQANAAGLKTSKSAVSLPSRHASRLSTSSMPSGSPQNRLSTPSGQTDGAGTGLVNSKPADPLTPTANVDPRRAPRRGVSFAGTSTSRSAEANRSAESTHGPTIIGSVGAAAGGGGNNTIALAASELGPDAIARQMWDGVF